jgi:hypothetical protein
MLKRVAVALITLGLLANAIAPATADAPKPLPVIDQAQALGLITSGCSPSQPGVASKSVQIAQALEPSPTPTPTATASLGPAPPPPATGPQTLVPPPLPTPSPSVTPPPLPTPTPTATANTGPVFIQRVSPEPSAPAGLGATPVPAHTTTPSPGPSVAPTPLETLPPNHYEVFADDIKGENKEGAPADLDGNVNVFYSDGILVGEHAHYDGKRFIDLTGHPFLRNKSDDSELHADSIRFDTQTNKAVLINGRGATTQGVETGHFYYTARTLTTTRDGKTHGDRASFSTCDRPHSGYHVEAKTLDITPNDKAIARSAVLFLGGFAVFFLPIVIIPLTHDDSPAKRTAGFVPVVGYSQVEGFFIKTKLGFAPSDYYYGYYRVDASTKLGLGLGYIAFFRRKDNKRSVDVNFYNARSSQGASPTSNLQINDTENFSKTLRGQFTTNYVSNYAPGVSLPPTFNLTGSLAHTGLKESQSYTFNETSQGATQSSLNAGFTDQRKFSPAVTQGVTLSFSDNKNSFDGVDTDVSSMHFNTLTHVTTRGLDYDLTFDKTDSETPVGISKLPELMIRPHSALDPYFKQLPITAQFTVGAYSESRSDVLPGDAPILVTQAADMQLTFGPAIAHFLASDFNGTVTVNQYAFATGDLKGTVSQNFSLTTPVSKHFVNAITYSENNSNGPQAEPFKTFDIIGGEAHQASDVIRLFNGDVYTFTLQSATLFNRTGQPLSYQLNLRPSSRSSLLLGGSYVPGPGNGFFTTNAQVVTPFGRGSDLQFSTNVDWKARGRLESKNVYYRRVIGDCYELLVGYNQDLKQITMTVEILAFPSHAASFGLQTQTSIIPGSLNFSNATP